MTNDDKNDAIENLLSMVEAANDAIELTTALRNIPFEAMTPELWYMLQTAMGPISEIMTMFKSGLQLGGQIIDNDALTAHINASIEM